MKGGMAVAEKIAMGKASVEELQSVGKGAFGVVYEEKTPSRETLTTPLSNLEEADRVTLPSNGVSEGKGTANSAPAQEMGAKSSQNSRSRRTGRSR